MEELKSVQIQTSQDLNATVEPILDLEEQRPRSSSTAALNRDIRMVNEIVLEDSEQSTQDNEASTAEVQSHDLQMPRTLAVRLKEAKNRIKAWNSCKHSVYAFILIFLICGFVGTLIWVG